MINEQTQKIDVVETTKHNTFEVVLHLEFEKRYIGKLVIQGDGTFSCKRNISHLFKKQNALGINYELLTSSSLKFKWIVIDFEGQKLITTRKYFLVKGKQFQFCKKGFEPQVFLPLDEFGIEKALAFERNNGEQSTLNFND